MKPGSVALVAGGLMAVTSLASAQSYRDIVESRQLTDNREFAVDVEFAAGHLVLRPAEGNELYRLAMTYDEELFRPSVRYRESRNRLWAELESVRDVDRDIDDLQQRFDLAISPHVPVDLQVTFGAADGDLELGGLQLREAHIKTGASETTVRFSSPNRAVCETLRFEVGAANFEARHLANARCQEIELAGGVAEMVLDFTGDWDPAVRTTVEIGMGLGEVRLRLPESLGVRIEMDRFLVGLDHNGFEKRGSVYTSRNSEDASARIEIEINAALGSVAIEWIPEP